MNTFEAITSRRSTRKFKQESIPNELLEKIIFAGRVAPCGGNSQTTHFIVIRNSEVLNELSKLVCETFAKMEITPDTYKSLQAAIRASKTGNYIFHYNAPVLIV